MFYDASAFDQDIGWCVTTTLNMTNMGGRSRNASSFNQDVGVDVVWCLVGRLSTTEQW